MLKIKYPVVFPSKTSLLGSSGGIAICDIEIMVNYVQVQRHRGESQLLLDFRKKLGRTVLNRNSLEENKSSLQGVVVSESPPLSR